MDYICTVCGYVHKPGTSFEDLPEDWVCPICSAVKDRFRGVDDKSRTRTYNNGEIAVLWQPDKCNHNGNCWRSLPQVFDPKKRPWVQITGADSTVITKVVRQCPTGALSIAWEKE